MSTNGRKARDSRLKAALLSSAWESWRRVGNPYPIYVPPQLQSVIPRIEPHAIRTAAAAPRSEPHAHVRRCIAGRTCGKQRKGARTPARSPASDREAALAHWASVHPGERSAEPRYKWIGVTTASFDPDDLITEVVACALFDGITEADASAIREAARPPNWQTSASTFYERSLPGTWDPYTATFTEGPANSPYQLLEHVEWHWSPEVDGGIINILNIDERTSTATDDLLRDMLDRLDSEETEGDRELIELVKGFDPSRLGDVQVFTYDLVRCLQSKFVATWEPGGLNVDEGAYLTAWQPVGQDRGRFFLRASKRIRYSEQADLGADFSLLLNLLAPAVNTMLLSQLTYDGIREGLDGPPGSPPEMTETQPISS